MKFTLMMPLRALGAAIRVGWANFRGFKVLTDPFVAEERAAICAECPFFDADEVQCRKCGCLIDAKVVLNTEKCPLDKWPRLWIKKSLAKPR